MTKIEKRYSASEIRDLARQYRDMADQLDSMVEVFDRLDSFSSPITIELGGKELPKNVVSKPVDVVKKITNDSSIIIDLIKNSSKDLSTSEIIEMYAKKIGATTTDIRGFVDATLNRFKGSKLESYKKGKMRGSYYKIKASDHSDAS